jgi:hypothetical protein
MTVQPMAPAKRGLKVRVVWRLAEHGYLAEATTGKTAVRQLNGGRTARSIAADDRA